MSIVSSNNSKIYMFFVVTIISFRCFYRSLTFSVFFTSVHTLTFPTFIFVTVIVKLQFFQIFTVMLRNTLQFLFFCRTYFIDTYVKRLQVSNVCPMSMLYNYSSICKLLPTDATSQTRLYLYFHGTRSWIRSTLISSAV